MRSIHSSRFEEDDQDNKLKIILVGDSGVGKTNIKERFCQNKFDPFSVKTVGVQAAFRKFISPFEERQQRFTVCFWDIVGQLHNKELVPAFFKNIIGVIYVFDLTVRESLQHLVLWKEKVQEWSQDRFISLLLGNKKDLKNFREVEERQALQFQHQNRIDLYRQVSALDPQGGIQQAIYQYLTLIQKQFDWGLKKPTRLKKAEAYHRSCI